MDPISNMLIMMKNAGISNKETVSFPYSKLKHAVAECLKKEGYVTSVAKKTKKDMPVLEVALTYVNGKAKLSDGERVSKPSRRVYYGVKDIRPVRNGFGTLVLSTPKGIISGKEAKKEQVGGEALFKVW